MPNSMTSISNSLTDFSIRDAGILDIPFIFDLIVRGSMEGAFTDSFLSSVGYIAVLSSLFASVRFFSKLQMLWPANRHRVKYKCSKELLVFIYQDNPIGFLEIKTVQEENEDTVKLIDKCAIKDQFRGKGHGKNMLDLFIARQSADTAILAYCNKYAKSMQHIFRRMHFRRTSAGKGLNLYVLGNFEQEQLRVLIARNS
ncbi:MAG: hypothetical protein NVSMB28_03580 [Collimonas sp.]